MIKTKVSVRINHNNFIREQQNTTEGEMLRQGNIVSTIIIIVFMIFINIYLVTNAFSEPIVHFRQEGTYCTFDYTGIESGLESAFESLFNTPYCAGHCVSVDATVDTINNKISWTWEIWCGSASGHYVELLEPIAPLEKNLGSPPDKCQ